MPFREENGLRFFQFESFPSEWIDHGLFTRRGGVSRGSLASLNVGANVGDDMANVQENKRRIFQTMDRPLGSTYDIWQVHSAEIETAEAPRHGEPYPKVDGVITDTPAVTLSMRFADCVPIMLADPEHRAVGMVHAGWQGTIRGTLRSGVEAMKVRFGSQPSRLLAGIGPAIHQHHYPVGPEVIQAFEIAFGERAGNHITMSGRQHHLDLVGANTSILSEMGLKSIENSGICTACEHHEWFSHRGQDGRAGRFAAVIGVR